MGFNSYLMNGLILEREKVVNPAHFYPNWAGLAVLFSKQIPISSKDFYFSVKTVKDQWPHIFVTYYFTFNQCERVSKVFLS